MENKTFYKTACKPQFMTTLYNNNNHKKQDCKESIITILVINNYLQIDVLKFIDF